MATTRMSNTHFSLIIIGDEILSGHRIDKHFAHILAAFKQRGLSLSQVQYVSDDRERITRVMAQALDSGDVVFSCGGIGATPDDHTRQAVAQALGVDLVLHPQAKQLITDFCIAKGDVDMATPQNQFRLNMGHFPVGADIVPNTYNGIPGFSIDKRLYCLPGFPVMAWPMLAWVLDTQYAHLFDSHVQISSAIRVFDVPESALIALMQRIESDYAPLKVYSLPNVGHPDIENNKPHIELGCKAPSTHSEPLAAAILAMKEAVQHLGGTVRTLHQPAVVAG
jgi:molybdopterin-biosynthesis enzyme MoeA-like protein